MAYSFRNTFFPASSTMNSTYNVEFTISIVHIVEYTIWYLVQCIVHCELCYIIQNIGLAAQYLKNIYLSASGPVQCCETV